MSSISKATTQHWPRLAEIELAAATRFGGWDVPASTFDEPLPQESLTAAQKAGLLWVATSGADAIGFAMAESAGEHLILREIDVLPERSGEGVGAALLEAVSAEASARGCEHVYLSTYRDVPWNAPWYARLGFEPVNDDDNVGQLLLATDREHGLTTLPRFAMRKRVAV